MNNILNNNYSLDIRDYEEGNLSNLKNDIYKMTVKLKEQSDSSQKEKKYLEKREKKDKKKNTKKKKQKSKNGKKKRGE